MSALRALLRQVRTCRICEHALPLGARPVLQISRSATILVAGQAPGRRVHQTGIPFNDPSGERLRAWMDIDRETFYDHKKSRCYRWDFVIPVPARMAICPHAQSAPRHGVRRCLQIYPRCDSLS